MKKNGADFTDQNNIRAWMNEGLSVSEISNKLQIEEKCVQSFVTHFSPKVEEAPKRTRRSKAQIEADERDDNAEA